ncbi:uncharacterized protein IL334_006749 [Kwoniella shivajii]|uniref:Alpha-1,3-mannosyltransferase CMT1 n=1 Tax=Kwoniella shivajii TaxID=564305 RepID=A0ABZ1D6S8_9TREE|nr:hypothetical protein IL334_006749 [Kwoniella shivajii]
MLRSTSSFFKAFRGGRPSSPPPIPYPHNRRNSFQSGSSSSSTSNMGLPLITFLIVGLLFLISLFSHPDTSTHHKFQMPALLPSKPPSLHISDPILASRINTTYAAYLEQCPNGPQPIYLDPSLTPIEQERYSPLKAKSKGRYLLVTNTRQIEDHLPDILNSIIVLTTFLGASHISLSILEGPSDDCTPKVINSVLLRLLHSLGISPSYINVSTDEPKIDWNQHNRIEKISELRNRALSPLWEKGWGEETQAVVFFNDVYMHARDILELLFQHDKNGADITTGMDWWKKRPEYYYDIWVGRTIDTGDLFYPIDYTWWSPSSNLFPNSPKSRIAYENLQPFQVFSSWNALAILSPKPFLPPYNVRFRSGNKEKGECAASECTLIASDFWKIGFGKVQVVPSVQFAYERDVALDIVEDLEKQKRLLAWKDGKPPQKLDSPIEWLSKPPEKVRCHPWPEVNGLSANVWEETRWVPPWLN